jgi:tRNA threonylcarbamoyl adenosine modification protein (Sua5/YciO/YrdC/YwlC family)
MKTLVMTSKMRFGKDRQGCEESVKQLGTVEVIDVPLTEYENEPISSSKIRTLLLQGEISEANRMLGKGYKIDGVVEHGYERGRKLGYPTANVGQIETLIPADGVYYGAIEWKEPGFPGERHPAIISVGTNPTYGNEQRTLEVHIPGGKTDYQLYDMQVIVSFVAKLRDMIKFDSPEDLCVQLAYDANVALAAWNLNEGHIICVQTDTVVGLMCRCDQETAQEIYQLKHRPQNKLLQVLIPDLKTAETLGVFDERSRELAQDWLSPDTPLTLVLPTQDNAPAAIQQQAPTVGMRVPTSQLMQDILHLFNPVFATSANISGENPPETVAEAKQIFGEQIPFYLDDPTHTGENQSSRVISVVNGVEQVLR